MARDFGKVRVAPRFEEMAYRGKNSRSRYNKRVRVWGKTGGYCFYCECGLDFRLFEVEHAHPKNKGGANDLSNLLPACQPCNVRKHNKNPVSWAKSRGLHRAAEEPISLGHSEALL